jgi:hypothetical protein
MNSPKTLFVICIKNTNYPASLELRKIYRLVPDDEAAPKQIRVIDESSEDYLYRADYFVSIRLPRRQERHSCRLPNRHFRIPTLSKNRKGWGTHIGGRVLNGEKGGPPA